MDAVEIHTGGFAQAFNQGQQLSSYIDQFIQGKEFVGSELGITPGHGLTLESTAKLCELNLFEEHNMCHIGLSLNGV